jgi:hypothetical protein
MERSTTGLFDVFRSIGLACRGTLGVVVVEPEVTFLAILVGVVIRTIRVEDRVLKTLRILCIKVITKITLLTRQNSTTGLINLAIRNRRRTELVVIMFNISRVGASFAGLGKEMISLAIHIGIHTRQTLFASIDVVLTVITGFAEDALFVDGLTHDFAIVNTVRVLHAFPIINSFIIIFIT